MAWNTNNAAVDKAIGLMPNCSKGVVAGSNEAMTSMGVANDPGAAPRFLEGYVIRSDPAGYGVVVSIPGLPIPIACMVLESTVSNYFGSSVSSPPIEGSKVLVMLKTREGGTSRGMVVGVIPPSNTIPVASADGSPAVASRYASCWEVESNATPGSDIAYNHPLTDPNEFVRVNSNACRPIDLAPGSWVVQNDQHVGIGVTAFAATVKATSRAQVRCSLIDDQVRIVSGHFQHLNASGTNQIFNDGGRVTQEVGITGYQCERSGTNKIGETTITQGSEDQDVTKSLKSIFKGVQPRITPKKRIQMFIGYLGDIFNLFVGKPDPAISLETEDAKSKDQGLAHVHIDSSGQVIVKSAGGVSFQRSDRIPVPKRMHQPWDPKGDKPESDQGEPPAKDPYDFGTQFPYARAAQVRDASAWRDLGAYWHLYNQSDSGSGKDFHLPEEADLDVPDDEYDTPGKGKEDFKDNDKRKSFFNMEPDGSIVIRDAWGSEIVMAGGNITITCAGQLQLRSGGNTVVLAGQDLVMKANKSADLTATTNDIRIAAERKVEVFAQGENSDGGILIHSNASDDTPWTGEGEAGHGSGIAITAPNSTVFVQAPKVHLAGSSEIQLETFDSNGELNGTIEMSANHIQGYANTDVIIESNSSSSLILEQAQAILAGPSVFLAGDTSAVISKGNQAMVPVQWATLDSSPYGLVENSMTRVEQRLNNTGWLAPYTPAQWEKIVFSYRSAEEYGTMGPTEVQGGTKFYLYQPSWAFMAKHEAETMDGATADTWEETGFNGAFPWPGEGARDNSYVQMQAEKNVTTSTGVAMSRSGLSASNDNFEPVSFDELETIQTS